MSPDEPISAATEDARAAVRAVIREALDRDADWSALAAGRAACAAPSPRSTAATGSGCARSPCCCARPAPAPRTCRSGRRSAAAR